MTAKRAETWPEVDRRKMENGRRSTDKCAEHCILVKQWDEHIHSSEKKAPLWVVLVLIGMVLSSSIFNVVSSGIMKDKFWSKIEADNKQMAEKISESSQIMAEKISVNNQIIQSALIKIQTDLAVAQSRQADIKNLIEKHMSNQSGVYGK